jgi:nitrogen fixation protein NifU and related proteins
MDNEIKREIIMENYLHPFNKEIPSNLEGYIKVNSNNESCIDNIDIYLKIENNIIKDIKFMGEACAISTSSTSIMIKLLLNKNLDEVQKLINNYENMINEGKYDANILGEALAYDEIYKQQNRKHCAMLPWLGIKEAIEKYKSIH